MLNDMKQKERNQLQVHSNGYTINLANHIGKPAWQSITFLKHCFKFPTRDDDIPPQVNPLSVKYFTTTTRKLTILTDVLIRMHSEGVNVQKCIQSGFPGMRIN